MKKIFVILPLLVVLGFIGNLLYPRIVLYDFNNICEAYKVNFKAVSKGEIDGVEAQMNVVEIAENSFTPAARMSFEAIINADPKQKYELYKLTIKDYGYDDWNCEVMERLFN